MRNRYVNFVLTSGLYGIYCCWRKYDYYYSYVNNCYDEYDNIPIDVLPFKDFFYYIKKYPRLIDICARLYKSHSAKVHRANKRILRILYDTDGNLRDCLFLTLTFTNDVLSSTLQNTRRTYVSRYLKNNAYNYLANIDFGSQNGREHYHAVVDNANIDLNGWSYGAINYEHIRYSPNKIATYINKLSLHSVKDTAGFLIYSRNRVGSKMKEI